MNANTDDNLGAPYADSICAGLDETKRTLEFLVVASLSNISLDDLKEEEFSSNFSSEAFDAWLHGEISLSYTELTKKIKTLASGLRKKSKS